MATRAADIRLHKVKQGGWTVVERHQTRPSCFAGVRGKKESIWREDRAEREVIYGTLRCILDQPWDDDDSRSGGWQANKSWLTVWEPLPICCSLRVWGMPSVKPLLPPRIYADVDDLYLQHCGPRLAYRANVILQADQNEIRSRAKIDCSRIPNNLYIGSDRLTLLFFTYFLRCTFKQ
ncbi:unnamed protein product, partial [Heterotrigona itama]